MKNTIEMLVATSKPLKDALLACNPSLFNSPKAGSVTIRFAWDGVSVSEAVNAQVDNAIKQAAQGILSAAEQATLVTLSAKLKAEETRLAMLASETREKISKVSVKGMKATLA